MALDCGCTCRSCPFLSSSVVVRSAFPITRRCHVTRSKYQSHRQVCAAYGEGLERLYALSLEEVEKKRGESARWTAIKEALGGVLPSQDVGFEMEPEAADRELEVGEDTENLQQAQKTILKALSGLKRLAQIGWSGNPLEVHFPMLELEPLLPVLCPQLLTQLLVSLVKVGYFPADTWLIQFREVVDRKLERFSTGELCAILWALAKLYSLETPTFNYATSHIPWAQGIIGNMQFHSCNPQEMNMALFAALQLKLNVHQSWLSNFKDAFLTKLESSTAFTTIEVLASFNELGFELTLDEVALVLEHLSENADYMDVEDTQRTEKLITFYASCMAEELSNDAEGEEEKEEVTDTEEVEKK